MLLVHDDTTSIKSVITRKFYMNDHKSSKLLYKHPLMLNGMKGGNNSYLIFDPFSEMYKETDNSFS